MKMVTKNFKVDSVTQDESATGISTTIMAYIEGVDEVEKYRTYVSLRYPGKAHHKFGDVFRVEWWAQN